MVDVSNSLTAVVSQFTRSASFNSRTAAGFEASPTTRTVEGASPGTALSLGGPSISTIVVTQSIAPVAKNDPAALAQATSLLSDRNQALTTIQDSLASATTLVQKLQPGSIQGLTNAELMTLASDLDVLSTLISSTSSTLKGDVDSFAAGVDLSADDVLAIWAFGA